MPTPEFNRNLSQAECDNPAGMRTTGEAAEKGMVFEIQVSKQPFDRSTELQQKLARVRDGFKRLLRHSQAKLRNLDAALLAKADQALEGYKYAKEHPELDNSEPWLRLEHTNVWDAAVFAQYFPDLRKRRGRPRGSSPVASNIAKMHRMDELIHEGFTSTKAARQTLKECGVRGEIKNKADYLVKVYRKNIAEKIREN